MQRAFDQLFQEVALIETPVMICLDRAGLVGPDGATHNGVFDIGYCRMFPNMVTMAPRDGSELRAMMQLASQHPGPTAIRFPRTRTPKPELELPAEPFCIGESELLRDGQDGCILAYGAMVYPALDVAAEIFSRHGLQLAVVNARFVKPLDGTMLAREFNRQPHLFSMEDHMLATGFGAAVLEHANTKGLDSEKLHIFAIEDEWIDHGQRIEALADAKLDVASMTKRVEAVLVPSLKPKPEPAPPSIHHEMSREKRPSRMPD